MEILLPLSHDAVSCTSSDNHGHLHLPALHLYRARRSTELSVPLSYIRVASCHGQSPLGVQCFICRNDPFRTTCNPQVLPGSQNGQPTGRSFGRQSLPAIECHRHGGLWHIHLIRADHNLVVCLHRWSWTVGLPHDLRPHIVGKGSEAVRFPGPLRTSSDDRRTGCCTFLVNRPQCVLEQPRLADGSTLLDERCSVWGYAYSLTIAARARNRQPHALNPASNGPSLYIQLLWLCCSSCGFRSAPRVLHRETGLVHGSDRMFIDNIQRTMLCRSIASRSVSPRLRDCRNGVCPTASIARYRCVFDSGAVRKR